MSSLPPISQYSSVAPELHDTFDPLGDLSPVDFTGAPQKGGARTEFTIGAWVRASAAQGKLTVAGSYRTGHSDFQIRFNPAGELTAGLAGQDQVRSFVSFTDGEWHFVAVSYAGNAAGESAKDMLRLYVDGSLLDAAPGNGPGAPSAAPNRHLMLGDMFGVVEFATCLVWSAAETEESMDVPTWDEEDPGGQGLLRGLRFTGGALESWTSGEGWAAAAHQPPGNWRFRWNTPCLQLRASAALTAPVLQQPAWTAMGWVHIESTTPGLAYFLAPAQRTNCGLRYDSTTHGFKAYIASTWPPDPRGSGYVERPVPAAAWHFVAFSYDGATLTLYVDDGPALSLPNQAGLQPQLYVGPDNQGLDLLCVQHLSLWSSALSADDIGAKAALTDPLADPTCLAWFPFERDAGDARGGETPTPSDPGLVSVGELQRPVSSAPVAAAPRQRRPAAASDADGTELMRYRDFVALAREHGIDPAAEPPSIMKRDETYLLGLAWYDTLLSSSKIADPLAARLRDRFARNLAAGIELEKAAPGAGRFTISDLEGVPTLFYRHRNGPVAVGAFPAELISGDVPVQLYVNVFLDLVALALAVLGLAAAASGVQRVVNLFSNRLKEICNRIRAAWDATASGPRNTTVSLGIFASYVMTTKTAYSLFSALISGTWWWVAFQIAAAILQFIALFIFPAALLAIRLALLVIAIVGFVKDMVALIAAIGQGEETLAPAGELAALPTSA